MSSIDDKLKSYLKTQGAVGGIGIPSKEAGYRFIEFLQQEIMRSSDIGESGVSALVNLECGDPEPLGDGNYVIPIRFTDDLHRKSLYPSGHPEGVRNLAALLNNGYNTGGKHVYGDWHGDTIKSRDHYTGAHFVESAIRGFMSSAGKSLNVKSIEEDITKQ